MKLLTTIASWFPSYFVDVPLEQTVSEVGRKAQIEIIERESTIQKERFALHMARAELEGVRSWREEP